jgi:hypothetical protein
MAILYILKIWQIWLKIKNNTDATVVLATLPTPTKVAHAAVENGWREPGCSTIPIRLVNRWGDFQLPA